MAKEAKKAKVDREENVHYIFAYLLIFVSGIIVYVTDGQKDKRLKFHALQAIFLGIIIFVILYLPFFHALWLLLGLLLWLYGMWIGVKAFQGEDIEIPVIGDYARKYSIK